MFQSQLPVERRKKKRKSTKLQIKLLREPPKKKQKLRHTAESKNERNLDIHHENDRQNDERNEWDSLLDNTTFPHDTIILNDVELIFNKLHSEFPRSVLNPFPLLIGNDHVIYAVPVILISQIYSLITDHTLVDRTIDDMKRQNKIRHFRVQIERTKRKKVIQGLHLSEIQRNRNQSVHHQFYDDGTMDVYVRTEDYKSYFVQNRISSQNQNQRTESLKAEETKDPLGSQSEILDRFMNRLIPNHIHHEISRNKLREYLVLNDEGKWETKEVEKWLNEAVTFLIRCGLMTQQMDDSYSLQYPKADRITISVSDGRKEIISLIRKRKYQQILKKEILRYRMKKSCLDSMFHLRDLLGAQIVKQTPCASGTLIQMA